MRSNIRNTREKVAVLRAALLAPSPESLCAQVTGLEECARTLRDAPPGDLDELVALSKDLHHARALIDHGMNLQLGWARILAASTAEYQPDGEPRALQPPGTVSIQG